MMRGKFILLLFFLITQFSAFAYPYDFGLFLGGANYFGDLNTNYNFTQIQPQTGLFVRNNFHPRFAFRTGVNVGRLKFSDRVTTDAHKNERNLSFQTDLLEINALIEFNFLKFVHNSKKRFYTPYLVIGAAGFYFDPHTELDGRMVQLQPLGTEGQNETNYTGREPYSFINAALVFGMGGKLSFARNWVVGFEISNRVTFTDYLDDVSTTYVSHLSLPGGNQGDAFIVADRSADRTGREGFMRGTSRKNDQYLFVSFSISYAFLKLRCPYPNASYR